MTAGLVATATPAAAACTVNINAGCYGDCMVNVLAVCDAASCTVNVLGTCNERASCLVNVVGTCTYPCKAVVNAVGTCAKVCTVAVAGCRVV